MELVKNHPLHDSYPSVVNLNNPTTLIVYTSEFPEFLDCLWAIEEKFHGFNLQVTYLPGESIKFMPDYVGSREIQITSDVKFYGVLALIEKYHAEFVKLREICNITGNKLTPYMEIIGCKVSHGIVYDIPIGEYRIRFIGMKINDVFLCPEDFYNFMVTCGIPDSMYVRPIAIVKGIQAVVDFDPIFNSTAAIAGDGSDMDRSYAEGIVAKPLQKHYINKGGKNIMIKKKHPRFEEFAEEKKVRIIKPEVDELRTIFKGFLNKNRISSVFSKIGPIASKLQMAQYIRMITDDARIDFFEQYTDEMNSLSPEDQKSVFNVGNFLSIQLLTIIESAA